LFIVLSYDRRSLKIAVLVSKTRIMKKIFYIWIGLICLNICGVSAQTSEIALLSTDLSATEYANFAGDLTYVPFDLVNGKVLVNAEIEGRLKTFMLDTGAPGLVLNKRVVKDKMATANSATGELKISQEIVDNFEWAGIKASETQALVLNMKHIEAAVNQDLAGLIGYDILRNAEVLFDYQRRLIILTKNYKSSWHQDNKPKAIIDIELVNHIPVIKVKIGKRTLSLGLDCGAEVNVLDETILKKIDKSLITKSGEEIVTGLDRNEKSADVAWISETNIKKDSYTDMKYLFTDLSALNDAADIQIDGLLGAPFFQSATFSINYEKRKLYVW